MSKEVKKFQLLVGAKVIEAKINTIKKYGKAYENMVHLAACSILDHVRQHGDVTLADRLIEALSGAVRKNALMEWFEAHGQLRYDLETKKFKFDKSSETKLAEAISCPFWEFKAESPYIPLDFNKSVTVLLTKVGKRLEARKEGDKNAKADKLPSVAAFQKISELVGFDASGFTIQ
jgi:hypothetical protein